MENPDNWAAELQRVEELEEAEAIILPFGYDYIVVALENISANLATNTLFSSGVELGRLIEVIIANKDKE